MDNLFNKIIYFNNYLYKVVKKTKKCYVISPLRIDYFLDIEKEYFHAYNILNIEEVDIRHYKNALEDDTKLTVKKDIIKENSIIIENLKDVYIYNEKLNYGFYKVLGTAKLKRQFIKNLKVKYYIKLLINEEIKQNYKEWRKEQLNIFLNLLNCSCCSNEEDIYNIINNNLLIEYQELVREYENNEKEEVEKENLILINEACPVCLVQNEEVYKGFYKCCHCICKKCFKNWKIKTCPICREEEENKPLTPLLGSIN